MQVGEAGVDEDGMVAAQGEVGGDALGVMRRVAVSSRKCRHRVSGVACW